MNKTILIVDDEKDIVELLQYNLLNEGFNVIAAYDGEDALNKLNNKPDLIILDIMMPKLNGFDTCKKIRQTKGFEEVPVVFLTAKSAEIDEIYGLELGANDYIQKPISPKKLIARVNSNLRKSSPAIPDLKLIKNVTIGPLDIDREKYIVFIDGKETVFPRKEFEILFYLANHPGKVFSRETLLKDIWGNDVYVVDRTVDVHIRKIREKLKKYSDLIETIKGVGYRFKDLE